MKTLAQFACLVLDASNPKEWNDKITEAEALEQLNSGKDLGLKV